MHRLEARLGAAGSSDLPGHQALKRLVTSLPNSATKPAASRLLPGPSDVGRCGDDWLREARYEAELLEQRSLRDGKTGDPTPSEIPSREIVLGILEDVGILWFDGLSRMGACRRSRTRRGRRVEIVSVRPLYPLVPMRAGKNFAVRDCTTACSSNTCPRNRRR